MTITQGEEVRRMSDTLDWVRQVKTVDAIETVVVDAMMANCGWQLLAIGIGSAGQTTLTFGWGWNEQFVGGTDK
jgi:hypothetical protein